MISRLSAIMLLLCCAVNLKAQTLNKTDSLQLLEIVNDVFDGMRTNDSSKISQHLHADLIMHTVSILPDGETKLSTASNPQAWLSAVAKPKQQQWDERTNNYKFNITEGLATVWMNYGFFIDQQFSHCGVNSFQLIKADKNWKIIYIIDTRKKEGCNIADFPPTN